MDDSQLNELICDLPARSIALMEDIDAAFAHAVSREASTDEKDKDSGVNRVTLRYVGSLFEQTRRTPRYHH